jgi:hypothetical protein
MSEVAEMFEEEEVDQTEVEIQAAFDSAVAGEADEDDTKLQMISAGATFKNVTRLYNQFMIDAGLAISKADRAQIVADTLEGRELDTEEGFDTAVLSLSEAVQGTTERSAAALIRSYAKKNGLEVYAKPKGEGTPRVSFASKFYDFLVANPNMSAADAEAYIKGDGDYEDTSANVQKNLPHYMGIHALVARVVA